MDLTEQILDFWYAGNFDVRRKAWFLKDDAFDAEIRSRFGADAERAAEGQLDQMAKQPLSALALILMLDQFPRNLYRNDAKTFATDGKAVEIARCAIANGHVRQLTVVQKIFFYLPFEHSENLADQDLAVEYCTALGDEDYLKYAIAHRDVIAKFGRFPHRNKVLGRETTQEEEAYLSEHGGF